MSSSQLDVWIQRNSNQNQKLLCGYWQIGFIVYMERKIQNCEYNAEEIQQNQRIDVTQLQNLNIPL